MTCKKKIDCLLAEIRDLEVLVDSMGDNFAISQLIESSERTFKILNELQQFENELIVSMGDQMSVQHKELIELSKTFEHYQSSSTKYRERIESFKEQEKLEELSPEYIPAEIKAQVPYSPKPTIADKPQVFLNDVIEKHQLSDFRKAFSLNDRFRFKRELFAGDETKMNQVIADLDLFDTYDKCMDYIHTSLQWNIEDETVTDFIHLLEKRFN